MDTIYVHIVCLLNRLAGHIVCRRSLCLCPEKAGRSEPASAPGRVQTQLLPTKESNMFIMFSLWELERALHAEISECGFRSRPSGAAASGAGARFVRRPGLEASELAPSARAILRITALEAPPSLLQASLQKASVWLRPLEKMRQ